MKISGTGKRKTDPGYGEGYVELGFNDDVLMDEEEMTSRLLEKFNSPNYQPPKLPGVANELMMLAQKPDVTIDDIVALLEQDTMLTGQVMKLVRSPIYAGSTEITSLNQALVRIGLNNLRDIVLQASMNLRVFRSDAYADTMDRLRKHSAITGHISKVLCKHVTDVEGEYAFLCGLLHDVGIAATLIALSDAGPKKKAPDLVSIWPAIDRVHAQAGKLIGELWDLPEQIREVVGCHHQVLVEGKPNRLAAVICIADQIARDRGYGLTPQDGEGVAGVSELEAACLESHGAVDGSMPKTLEQAREALDLNDATIGKVHTEMEAIEADLG